MLISGVTVMVAMAGMLIAGNAVFTSIGVGTMLVVAVAMLGSVTVLPALLSKLGDKVREGPRAVPRQARATATTASRASGAAVLDRVLAPRSSRSSPPAAIAGRARRSRRSA